MRYWVNNVEPFFEHRKTKWTKNEFVLVKYIISKIKNTKFEYNAPLSEPMID